MSRVDKLYDEGVRLITLMWNNENCMGYPNSLDMKIMRKGLKPFGIQTVKYMKERKQFGRPLSAFQGLQWMIAEMETKIEAAKLLVYKAAWLKQNKLPYSVDAAKAKLFAAEVAMEVTTKAVQLFGGYGYIREYDVERMMRDAKITEIYEGTSEVQRMVISGAMFR